jgi:hypothetical protein
MLATYGVDVLDPAVSCRRVHVLLRRLPPAAREQDQVWSSEASLLAVIADELAQLTYVTLRANGGRPSKPKPIKRPGFAHPEDHRPARRALPAGASAAADGGGDGTRKAGSWADAVAVLAGLPGVVTEDG